MSRSRARCVHNASHAMSNNRLTPRSAALAILIALSALIGGCAGRMAPWVRARTSAALACAPDDLTATPTERGVWRVSGCGREETFHCVSEPWLGFRCEPRRGRAPERPSSPAAPEVVVEDDIPTAPAPPPGPPVPVPSAPILPDPRLDAILERVRALDRSARDETALAVLEDVAVQPTCPPLLWDTNTAHATRHGIMSLDNPTEQRGLLYAGVPMMPVGGVLSLITGLVFAFDGYSPGFYSVGGGSFGPRTQPDSLYAGLWVTSGVLVVAGFVMMLTGLNVFNPSARAFNERRAALLDRRGPRPRGLGPTDASPVFETDCPPGLEP